MDPYNQHFEHKYFIGVAVFLAVAAVAYGAAKGSLSHIPGPWYSRWTDIVLSYYWLRGQKSHYVHALHQKYGPVVRISPNEVDICDISAKQVIYGSREVFKKSPWYQRLVGPFVHNIFSTQDSDFHRRQRRLLSGPMAESSLKAMEPIIATRASMAVQRMEEEMKSRGAADVFKWSMFMAMDVIGELSFGESFRMLEQGKKIQYIDDLETVATAGAVRAVFPWLVAFCQLHKVPTPFATVNQAARAGRNLRQYAVQSMDRYRRLVDEDFQNVKQTLFTKVFNAHDEESMTFDEIRDAAQSYIVAGSDTTANTLTYLLWAVCKDVGIRDKLVEEVQGLRGDFADHDLAGLPYLNQVIEETLRLYSAAPSTLPRLVPHEGAKLAGYWFKGGVSVSTQAYSLHRDPAIFPRPEVFDPSRWSSPTREMKDAFMPFGAGSRICIGLHLARKELRMMAALFFRTFPNAKVSRLEGMCDSEMDPCIYFLTTPKGKRCLIQAP